MRRGHASARSLKGVRLSFANQSPLFPPHADRARLDDFLTRELAAAHDRVTHGSVTPRIDLAAFRQELAGFDYRAPCALEDVLSWTIAKLERGIVHVTHPRYFGLFNPGPTFPAQCADRIAAVFNPQLATATTSPVAVDIENHVIRSVARRAGFPEGAGGHFTTGGSEANLTALVCALTQAHPAFATEGARAFPGHPTFYVSKECHLAWIKIAHQTGIGRDSVRFVSTDGSGRMDSRALETLIDADRRARRVPVMVVATAGTTNAGMIDPLTACRDLARAYNLWFHVDAAWGGALIASDRFRGVLAGIEQADSITIDAHKWFATTMGCGMILVRHAPLLSSTFQVSADFMPSNTASADPFMTSVQWSRRFLGLRLFLSLAAAGWAGYAQHVERSIELIEILKGKLVESGWRIVNDSHLAVLCIEPPAGRGDVRTIVRGILDSGRAWVSVATFEGRQVLRACVTHGETTSSDVAELVNALETLV
ncbi:MAG: pyridoxal-dependent decarboxylase [Aliidongia sp.]